MVIKGATMDPDFGLNIGVTATDIETEKLCIASERFSDDSDKVTVYLYRTPIGDIQKTVVISFSLDDDSGKPEATAKYEIKSDIVLAASFDQQEGHFVLSTNATCNILSEVHHPAVLANTANDKIVCQLLEPSHWTDYRYSPGNVLVGLNGDGTDMGVVLIEFPAGGTIIAGTSTIGFPPGTRILPRRSTVTVPTGDGLVTVPPGNLIRVPGPPPTSTPLADGARLDVPAGSCVIFGGPSGITGSIPSDATIIPPPGS
ncbi:hypothetical protein BDP27DRAFT_1409287 [Rhodocollybia butyracea]|uniref:Uncharacterized protein n=1 Tax=Rhodocollybia butyracea TaxID=206335 RepID=A0A9P5P5M2_9AGAR|nr:hypothetical protein BDP27DRAFT_1409287 [Rhodocollybia butyracea]